MRLVLATLLCLVLPAPVLAQAPRPPRVHIDHERGPITARDLRAAWTARRFQRCQEGAHDDVAHLHVRVDPDGTVRVDHGLVDHHVTLHLRCVVEVLRTARFGPQTEPTHAHVTIYFRPTASPHRRSKKISARSPGSRPLRAHPRR